MWQAGQRKTRNHVAAPKPGAAQAGVAVTVETKAKRAPRKAKADAAPVVAEKPVKSAAKPVAARKPAKAAAVAEAAAVAPMTVQPAAVNPAADAPAESGETPAGGGRKGWWQRTFG